MTDFVDERIHPLDVLADSFVCRLRAGENPDIEDYVRRCPESAA